MDTDKIRRDFPILKTGLIYMDSVATSLTPEPVLDAMMEYYRKYRANVHRGVHRLSRMASEHYELSHEKMAEFINASSAGEIILTKNATESINQIALSLDLKKGDTIVTTSLEHHSNFLPWLRLKKRERITLEVIKPSDEGLLDIEDFKARIDANTKLVSVTHVSNVLGSIAPVKDIGEIAKDKNALYLVDAAQSVPHMPVDVKDIGCDFMAFSGHKMLGPTGTGVLYIKEDLAERMNPVMLGGGAIEDVTLDDYTLTKSPERWEAGTPNIAGAVGLSKAIDYLKETGLEDIKSHEKKLTQELLSKLKNIKNLELYGPSDSERRGGIVSFNIKGINSHDVAAILDDTANIMVRSGHHCAMPLMKTLGVDGTVRASVYLYNTRDEVDKLVSTVEEIANELT